MTRRSYKNKLADHLIDKVVDDIMEIKGLALSDHSSRLSNSPNKRRYIDSDDENDSIVRAFNLQEKQRLQAYKQHYLKNRQYIRDLDKSPINHEKKVRRLQDSFNESLDLERNKKFYKRSIERDFEK